MKRLFSLDGEFNHIKTYTGNKS